MDELQSTKQVNFNRNPTGAGGFQERPEDRNDGRWKKENSQKYLLNFFLHMKDSEFADWGQTHPKEERTVAQVIAYEHVKKSRTALNEYREITNRTEGMPRQIIEQTGELNLNVNAMLDKVYGDSESNSTT